MSAKRFTGKTESDAVMNAAMELGIPSTDLKYTVIDSGSNGFLGLFKKPVIIEIKEEEKETEVMKSQTIEKEQPKKKAEKKPSKKVDEMGINHESSCEWLYDSRYENKMGKL